MMPNSRRLTGIPEVEWAGRKPVARGKFCLTRSVRRRGWNSLDLRSLALDLFASAAAVVAIVIVVSDFVAFVHHHHFDS